MKVRKILSKRKVRRNFINVTIISGFLIIALMAVAFLAQQKDTSTPSPLVDTNPRVVAENKKKPKGKATPTQNDQSYTHTQSGFSLNYPSDWLKLECEDRPEQVYFASDERGLGIQDGQSILCGGGSGFTPQAAVQIRNQSEIQYILDSPDEILSIDQKEVYKKTTTVESFSLKPKGLETTLYVVQNNDRYIEFSYNKWPNSYQNEYDVSEESKKKFDTMVDKLRFD